MTTSNLARVACRIFAMERADCKRRRPRPCAGTDVAAGCQPTATVTTCIRRNLSGWSAVMNQIQHETSPRNICNRVRAALISLV